MAGGSFLHRVMSYIVNELVVNSLANNLAFQRFAVRTSRKIESLKDAAARKSEELAEQMKEATKNIDVGSCVFNLMLLRLIKPTLIICFFSCSHSRINGRP
ncbi:hypothetical protein Droror1_Dr00026119 [Drosera rotundifolia]